MSGTAVLVAVLAGLCFALSSVLQHHAARREPRHEVGDLRLLARLVRRPVWLAGRGLAVAGIGLQALALRFGPLSTVQPLMVSGLFLSVPLEARLERRRADGRDLRAVVIAGLGLVLFLVAATPDEGVARPSAADWAYVLVACAALVGLCVLAARRHPAVAGTWLGVATGIVYGLTAALLKAGVAIGGGPVGVLTDWVLYGFLGVAALGLVLSQNAFQTGGLAAPLTAFAVCEPIAALGIGVTAFRERLDTAGPNLVLVALGLVAMAVGIRWLCNAGDRDEQAQPAMGPGLNPAQ